MRAVTFDPPPATPAGVIARLRGFLSGSTPPETPEQAADRRACERAVAGTEIDQLAADAMAELPALAAAEEKARKRLESLRPGYQEALAAFDRAQAAHSRRAHDLAYARERAVRRVEAAAEPVIAEFVADLMELFEVTLKTQIVDEERNHVFDGELGRTVAEVWSNAPSIDARRKAILAARNEAEALKAEPDQSQIRERLVAMVEALPDAQTMVKVLDPPKVEQSRRWPSAQETMNAHRRGGPVIEVDTAEARRSLARRGIRGAV